MGVDLTLMPFEDGASDTHAIAHTMLFCERCEDVFDAIGEREEECGMAVPTYFGSFRGRGDDGETRYGDTQHTRYGDALRTMTAGDLCAFANDDGVIDNPVNRATWAYLAHLPRDTRVALYWH